MQSMEKGIVIGDETTTARAVENPVQGGSVCLTKEYVPNKNCLRIA